MDKIKIFIGVDQTGAVNQKGEPRPLNISLIDIRKNPIYKTGLKINKLNSKNIHELLKNNIPEIKKQKILICVDTVFGLPQILKVKPKKIFTLAEKFSFKNKSYGAETAYNFFKQFLISEDIPQRKVETLVKANIFLIRF